jgi:hypothetical protein
MKYFIVSALTLLLSLAIIKYMSNVNYKNYRRTVIRQSNNHFINRIFNVNNKTKASKPISQLRKYNAQNTIKAIVMNDKAYWVLDNVFYIADAQDKEIDSDSIKPIDIENISKEEVEKLLSILDNLKGREKE